MPRLMITITSALVLAGGIAACGSSSSSGSSGSASSQAGAASTAATATTSPASHVVSLSAASSGATMFSSTSLTALAGKVVIHFTNHAPEGHNFTLQSPGGQVVAATPTFTGGTKSLTVTLTAGKYVYYCTVPGHRTSGMQGTLTVT